jgi:glycosyltransferase involved in cell wall biosynthesis
MITKEDVSKLKICMIFNGAPDYRRAIYLLLENNYACDWNFIKMKDDASAMEMDVKMLANVHYINERVIIKPPLTYQNGLLKLLFNKGKNVFFIAGSLWSVGIWLFCIFKKMFFPQKRIYFWSHGILGNRGWLRNSIAKLFFSLPDGIFTYGDRARQVMIRAGLDGDSIWPIHNSLDYDVQVAYRNNFSDIYKKHFGNSAPVLFFIGRLTPVKKLDMLIEAFSMMLEKGIDANLVFVGDGPMKIHLQIMVKDLNLENKVWFYGKCFDEREKSELITNADLCVAPGNIGLTAMDSLVYGTPCITMDNFDKQMPEHEAIKEGITGSFFKEDDVDDLTLKTVEWLQRQQDRNIIRQNCYTMIDKFWNPNYQIKIIKEHLR